MGRFGSKHTCNRRGCMNGLDRCVNEKYCGEDCATNFETLKPIAHAYIPQCKREGCAKGVAYVGAAYCGDTCVEQRNVPKTPALNLDPCAREGCKSDVYVYGASFCGASRCITDPKDSKTPALKDVKESLGARSKPDITHVRLASMVYESRAKEYGNDKYERANYLRKVANMAAAFRRYRDYLRADLSHTVKNLDSMEHHLANDPNLEDLEGMKAAAYSADTDAGLNFPASGLPHIAHGAASKSMAITQAVDAGLLPEDPGQPWKDSGD